ncbi:MAG TPA: DMT family transporter [Trebonia sp.]|nr:DMT family transporter [Trebonia sp.]
MIAAALAAAVLYGAGAAVEQRQAAAAPASSAGRPRLLLLLARQPLWLAGIALQAGGFAAHAAALRSGALATVQMLVSAELVVAVVVVRIFSGRRVSPASWGAALTVVAAIAAFLALASPAHDHPAGPPHYAAAAVLGAALTGAGAVAAAAAGLRAAGRRRAVLLAVAAGLADSCSAVVTMAFSHVASHGLAALATSWAGYALVVCGVGNVLLTQTAYQAGLPMLTLPVIAAVTPVASVAVGIGLLGEAPRTGLAGGIAAGLAVAVTSVALACLARSLPHPAAKVGQQQQNGTRPTTSEATIRGHEIDAPPDLAPARPGRDGTAGTGRDDRLRRPGAGYLFGRGWWRCGERPRGGRAGRGGLRGSPGYDDIAASVGDLTAGDRVAAARLG